VIFTSYWFVLFGAGFFPLYWVLRDARLRLGWLLAACAVFHAHFAGAAGVVPIIVLGSATYLAALSRRRWAIRIATGLTVLALVIYKYSHFIAVAVVGRFAPAWGAGLERGALAWLPAAPPLAISFFAFEFVHYLTDVGRGQAPIRHPARFVGFAIFFPSLVAGPIKRFEQFEPAMEQGLRGVSGDQVATGLVRVGLGLFKKVIIADYLTGDLEFWHPLYGRLSLLSRWEFVIAIGFRILLDFSGYSDIAIGLAQMMGIALPENFRWPYLATSVAEFWRRWHISLSTWIRDYVYIPLGGSRRGVARRMLNGLIAFGLVGLWHGPAWNFVLWGVYHGVGLAVCSNYAAVLGAPGRALAAAFGRWPLLGWALTMIFVFAGWVLFFYPLDEALHLLKLLFIRHR
jgi:alginate O-acetyltransferase complex protein AlgI